MRSTAQRMGTCRQQHARPPIMLVVWLLALSELVQSAGCVIVDGAKKPEISATRRQSDEKSMIDSFNTKTCGMSDPNLDEREFVNMAREGQFPWMVSFQIQIPQNASAQELERAARGKPLRATARRGRRRISSNKNVKSLHFCAGFFISDRWILSAAHCFTPSAIVNYLKNDKLKVVTGSHRVSSRNRMNRHLDIKRIYYHSQFNKSMPVGFDIALVELDEKEKVKFSQKRTKSELGEQDEPFMNSICLPRKDKRYQFNESARIAGWGLSNADEATSMPSKLLTTDILISERDKCVRDYSEALKSDRPRDQSKKYDDFICASYKNTRDACQSDSGGPLMQFAGGKAVAIGIVSYGIGCATKGVPGLYTRTSAYVNWIKDITKNGEGASVAFKLIEGKVESGSSVSASLTFQSLADNEAEGRLRRPSGSTTVGPTAAAATAAAPSTTTANPGSGRKSSAGATDADDE